MPTGLGSCGTGQARVVRRGVLVLASLIVTVGCYPNPNDLRPGSSSAGGQGGTVAKGGAGGAGVSTGGVPPTGGFGGTTPGTGGATPTGGNGGSKTGTGGATPTGGAPAGQGGAQSGNGGAAAGSGGYAGAGTALIPSTDGWVDRSTNAFAVQGAWYAISDVFAYGAPTGGDCVTKGMHPVSQCSMVTAPPLGGIFHPTADGKLCTSGTAAQVVLHPVTGVEDYDYIWGASIGFDFNGTGRTSPPFKYPYDAVAHGVRGIQFDLEWLVKPATGLRVAFPIQAADGSDTLVYEYWGGTAAYPPSPVVAGTNKVYWTDVASPMGDAFDATKLGAIHFAVPTTTTSATSYSFCVSNLKVLTGTPATGT